MLKKVMIMVLMIGSLFLCGCGKNESNNNKEKENITYTNKFECTKEDTLTKDQVFYATKEEPVNGEKGDAVKVTYSRSYDFDENGENLLAYYDITTYDYILDYDMDKQKAYYENNCKEIDQKTYKSCEVILDDKRVVVTSEIDLSSEVAKEYLTTVSLNDVKENYADTPYTCK